MALWTSKRIAGNSSLPALVFILYLRWVTRALALVEYFSRAEVFRTETLTITSHQHRLG